MRLVADFHIHSKYSRAVSKEMTFENLDKWAKIKGIHILASGDFTHPNWFKEIREKLEPAEYGFFKLKDNYRLDSIGKLDGISCPRFVLATEVSCIYSKNSKLRKIHYLILAPDIRTVEKINNRLSFIGNLSSDGRPILGLDSKELLKICLDASSETILIPSHAWTPWFSIFGSKSGFDSIEECFEELSHYIYAIETGLSSDPQMNWRLSKLDNITLISNSDSHSLIRIGREANVFDINLSYKEILETIKNKDKNKFLYTIEFFPEEGKYHYDGHRLCNVSLDPESSKIYNLICPKCSKPLTLGVLFRVNYLADRENGFLPPNNIPFKNMIPLDQIIAEALNLSGLTKSVWQEYENLIKKFGNEFNILFEIPFEELNKATKPLISEGVARVREGRVKIKPGYDGEYGKVKIFTDEEREKISNQPKLF